MIVSQMLLVGGLLLGAPASKEVKAELVKLQGTWKAVGGEKQGKKADEAIKKGDMKLVIKNDKWTITGIEEGQTQKSEKTGTLELDLSTDPKSMDMVFEGGGQFMAIYELDGDKLTICFGMERPKDFETDAESFERLIVYERQKKKSR